MSLGSIPPISADILPSTTYRGSLELLELIPLMRTEGLAPGLAEELKTCTPEVFP